MSNRKRLLSTAFALMAAGIAIQAFGQGNLEKLDKAYRQGPCSDDLRTFCARVEPGEARVADCMAAHFREIKPACRGAITAARNKFDALAEACKGDAEKLCQGVPYREGRVLSCLKTRQSNLGPACAKAFKRVGSDSAVTQ
ncbi:MAG TPA: cysteine rich repeat-containing protein [Burkholderiales bacterium]|nr:cysteine rich repeat-containing protein [Burkholderiales bacterium]